MWQADCGVLICGTGVGISIAANKVNGVRAAVCSDTATARLVKEHNNANIIAFGARIVGTELAKDIVKAYLDAEFQGGRHQTRIDMIHEIEKRNANNTGEIAPGTEQKACKFAWRSAVYEKKLEI